MTAKQIEASGPVSPNLVPMVDIMFLLLLFFMLGADMGQRELEEVKLPLASSTKEETRCEGDERKLTLNVYHEREHCPAYETTLLCTDADHWSIGIKGEDFRSGDEGRLKARIREEVREHAIALGEAPPDFLPGTPTVPSALKVMIRADQAALYQFVQRALGACAEAGIYKIEVGAARPIE